MPTPLTKDPKLLKGIRFEIFHFLLGDNLCLGLNFLTSAKYTAKSNSVDLGCGDRKTCQHVKQALRLVSYLSEISEITRADDLTWIKLAKA